MLSTPDGPFINLARLNFAKYAARPNLAKVSYQSVLFIHSNRWQNVVENVAMCVKGDSKEVIMCN